MRRIIVFLIVFYVVKCEVVPAVKTIRAYEFLEGADPKFKAQYQEILKLKDVKKKDIRAKIDEFAKGLPEKNQKLYKDFSEFLDNRQKELDKQRAIRHKILNPEAQEFDDKYTAIAQNQELTVLEECEKIAALNGQYSVTSRDQLQVPRQVKCTEYRYRANH
ncbi:unnamed protein product [Bursaphelenchus okinawaensis]|uniref:SXP/RAL-2 family protein Ani s 5-like cation-binding domain-containing protein n=1 Tax=Bursaphelenchus okinawaensis TaxID=465554 RepID=A0A811KZ61_9BILA|nr:unnamed protein product [Bursaphelenchus okinawaensis]CAG9114089.1 unnamed protein product [Bursaphelenchus okinawaensis]